MQALTIIVIIYLSVIYGLRYDEANLTGIFSTSAQGARHNRCQDHFYLLRDLYRLGLTSAAEFWLTNGIIRRRTSWFERATVVIPWEQARSSC